MNDSAKVIFKIKLDHFKTVGHNIIIQLVTKTPIRERVNDDKLITFQLQNTESHIWFEKVDILQMFIDSTTTEN